MRRMLEKILHQYGTAMVLRGDGSEYSVRGILQPTFSRSQQNMERTVGVLGVSGKNQYVYTGPAIPEIREGWILGHGERQYVFRRVETVYYGDAPAYQWGLCMEMGE